MQINNLSFTSKINFVDKADFEKVVKGEYVDFSKDPAYINSVRKADDYYTYAVRTCGAGGIHSSKTGESAGYHSYDCQQMYQNLDFFVDRFFKNVENPDQALLLGGKHLADSPYSMRQFLKLKELLEDRVENVSVIEEHVFPWSESDIYYSGKDDTYTIYSMYRPYTDFREHAVLSPEELKVAFKKIKIAPSDTLQIKGLDVTI